MADYTSLHRVTGSAPGPLTDEMLERAIEVGATEAEDLDWKTRRPSPKGFVDSDEIKDIAAMANAGGGLIVCGVTESERAATGREDVGEVSEVDLRTYTTAPATAIHPPVFGVRAEVLPAGDGGPKALVFIVPPSDAGPHLIYRNAYFGAPMRNGPDTIWMQEPQVAAAYRSRFEAQRESRTALADLYKDAVGHQRPTDMAWMYAVARPRTPRTPPSRPTRGDVGEWLTAAQRRADAWLVDGQETPLQRTEYHNARIGLRRWETPIGDHGSNGEWLRSWAGIHHDGSIVLASAVGGQPSSSTQYRPPENVAVRSCEQVVAELAALVRIGNEMGHHSDYDVQLGVEHAQTRSGGSLSLTFEIFDPNALMNQLREGATLSRFRPVTATMRHDLDDYDFLQQTCDIAEDVVNQAGFLELTDLLRDPPPTRPGRRY